MWDIKRTHSRTPLTTIDIGGLTFITFHNQCGTISIGGAHVELYISRACKALTRTVELYNLNRLLQLILEAPIIVVGWL